MSDDANRIRVVHLEGMLILESRHALNLHAQRDALLEALEMVRDADNDRIADDGHQYGIPSQARAKIDAAIAKARGGETEQQMISTLKDSIASAAAFKKARGTK